MKRCSTLWAPGEIQVPRTQPFMTTRLQPKTLTIVLLRMWENWSCCKLLGRREGRRMAQLPWRTVWQLFKKSSVCLPLPENHTASTATPRTHPRRIDTYAHTMSSYGCSQQLCSYWQKVDNNPNVQLWTNKRWYIHKVEYYLAMKRNEVLLPYSIDELGKHC